MNRPYISIPCHGYFSSEDDLLSELRSFVKQLEGLEGELRQLDTSDFRSTEYEFVSRKEIEQELLEEELELQERLSKIHKKLGKG